MARIVSMFTHICGGRFPFIYAHLQYCSSVFYTAMNLNLLIHVFEVIKIFQTIYQLSFISRDIYIKLIWNIFVVFISLIKVCSLGTLTIRPYIINEQYHNVSRKKRFFLQSIWYQIHFIGIEYYCLEFFTKEKYKILFLKTDFNETCYFSVTVSVKN